MSETLVTSRAGTAWCRRPVAPTDDAEESSSTASGQRRYFDDEAMGSVIFKTLGATDAPLIGEHVQRRVQSLGGRLKARGARLPCPWGHSGATSRVPGSPLRATDTKRSPGLSGLRGHPGVVVVQAVPCYSDP